MNVLHSVVIFAAAFAAGMINSVAGGGTLITFPSLIAYGIPSVVANATNTAVVWPGTVSSALAYREDLTREKQLLTVLLVPSFIGGLLGAVVLVVTPERVFAIIVPFLVLFATVIFAASDWFKKFADRNANKATHNERVGWVNGLWGFFFQLFVATYGGYFGAGMGILMLASLSVMGLRDIHRMNALKTVLGSTINGIALVYFIVRGLIVWEIALMMAVGAIIGGYAGARLAKRVDQRLLRTFIVIVGLVVSVYLLARVI
jgi:uncharacterized membrane protein YfcA